jgi:hypothetical protein
MWESTEEELQRVRRILAVQHRQIDILQNKVGLLTEMVCQVIAPGLSSRTDAENSPHQSSSLTVGKQP